jgi:hypothetical protein
VVEKVKKGLRFLNRITRRASGHRKAPPALKREMENLFGLGRISGSHGGEYEV